MAQQGVYETRKKDGSVYYRASLTYKSKHISLGSFSDAADAERAYRLACALLRTTAPVNDATSETPEKARHKNASVHMPDSYQIDEYDEYGHPLSFTKWVMLINLRDNRLYCNGPIYLRNKYFEYYLDLRTVLRFSADELFFYTHHTIQRRGNHLFFADFGMQTSVLSRYGIRSFAVPGRDYVFRNGDPLDFRSGNLVIVNRYAGVRSETLRGRQTFTARIHVNGDLVIGHYQTEREAAIAYNKAADMLNRAGVTTDYQQNYIEDMSDIEYRLTYEHTRLSGRFLRHVEAMRL